ncbi:MAG: hypothetical protein OEV89_08055 [Desulfobulbaceae bacterium]|nr:hypothetical protein [Desulfobulbaceae bacterium]
MSLRRVAFRHTTLSLLAVFLTSTGNAVAGQAVSSSWSHEEKKDSPKTDAYAASYTVDLQQDLTEAMSLQEAFRYNRNWRQQEETEGIDPSLRFAVKNDLFNFDLSGSASEQRNSIAADRSRRSWEAAWVSNWKKRFFPNLRTSYGRDFSLDDESPHLQDSESTREAVGVDWDFELFKTHYNFNRSQQNDNVTFGESTATNHFGRLDSSGRFFNNRLSLGFSQQYSASQTESATAVGAGGVALLKQTIAQVLTGHDLTPLITDAGELNTNSLMADSDVEIAAGVYTDGFDNPPLNVAFRVDLREVNRVYLYTEKDVGLAAAGAFTMDLYGSMDGTDYQRIRQNVPFVYNSVKKRFEITLDNVTTRWLKLVVTNSPVSRVDFCEIEAYNQVVSTEAFVSRRDKSVSNISDLNMGYRFSSTLGMTYNLTHEFGNYSSLIDYSRQNQIGQMRWTPGEYLTSAFGVSENQEAIAGQPETMNRAYTLRLSTPPVPSVDMNLGLSKTERYQDKSLLSTSYATGLYTSAALYPDLDANLDLTYGRTEYENTSALTTIYGAQSAPTGTSTKDYGSRLSMTARLIPRLTADLSADYRNIQGAVSTETVDDKLTLNWRVSDILSFVTAVGKKWENWQSSGENGYLQTSVAPTDNTQFALSYYFTNEKQTVSSRYSLSGSWAIGPHFTLQGNGSYVERTQENVRTGGQSIETDWLISTQLVARF